MKLYDRIVEELINGRKKIAMEVYEKSRDSAFEISSRSLRWLKKNGYIIDDRIRSNILEFFRTKVELVGDSFMVKPSH